MHCSSQEEGGYQNSVICIPHIQGRALREFALTKTTNLTSVGSNTCTGPPIHVITNKNYKTALPECLLQHPIVGSNYFNYIILTVCAHWAMGWTVQGSNPGRNKFLSSPLHPYRFCGPPSLLIDGLVAVVQRPRRDAQGTYLHLAPMFMSETIPLFLLDVHMVRPRAILPSPYIVFALYLIYGTNIQ